MTNTAHGNFVWYELLTSEPPATLGFYEHVLGWTSDNSEPIGAHAVFATEQGPLASVTDLPPEARAMGAGPFWTSVVQVDNVDDLAEKVRQLGGRLYHGPTDYPGVGRLAVVADPFGAVLTLLTRDIVRLAHDPSKPGEVCWRELLSADHEAAFAFWSALFGWVKSSDFDMGPMGKYAIFGRDGADFGGMFTKPKDVPVSAWVYYFQVSNLDAAIERATRGGGKLCNGPMRIPSGARIAQLSDPQGAMFAVHENPKQ